MLPPMRNIMTRRMSGKLVARSVRAAAATMGTICLADNPVVQTKFTADPAPIVVGDTVYLITSHDEDDARGFHMLDWMCYSSKDLVNWTDHTSGPHDLQFLGTASGDHTAFVSGVSASVVPEPESFALIGVGLIGFGLLRRNRRRG